MPIATECPYCQTRRNVEPEDIGETVRCKNPTCKKQFVAQDATARKKPAAPPPPPEDYGLPHLPPDPADIPEAEVAEVAEAEPVEVVEATTFAPPAKEVVWTPGAALPGGPPLPPKRPAAGPAPGSKRAAPLPPPPPVEEPAYDDAPVVRRRRRKKKKSNRGAVILIGLISALVIALGVGVASIMKRSENTEEAEAAKAKAEYDKGEFGTAGKLYGELATKYAERQKAEEYQFFRDLSDVRKAVGSVVNREDPKGSLDKFNEFVGGAAKKPLARPDQHGNDVFEAGRKLGADLAGYAQDRIAAFKKDRTKANELQQADDMIEAGRKLMPAIQPFRTRDSATTAPEEKELAAAADAVQAERKRLNVIDQSKALLQNPTDPVINEVKLLLKSSGLADDPEGQALVQAAEGGFLKRVRYDRDPAPGLPPAAGGAPSLVFVAPVGAKPVAGKEAPAEATGGVFLAVARGVLYALDEEGGEPLWTVRVGPGVYDPPAVARVSTADGLVDLAVVAGEVEGKPAVAGYALRTGQPRWRQELPAPAAGPAAVIGGRAFVPLRDAAGTIVVLDLVAGNRLGRITLGQPAGPVVARPGTNLLYAAGESRRVFVFDVEAADLDGVKPRCVRVLGTDHPAGTLKAAPIFLGPPGDEPGAPRWLLLSQADGPTQMVLRAFPLAPTPVSSDPNAPPLADPIASQPPVPIPGWTWFPPVSDGERLAAVTDAGQLRLFGVNQPGSQDLPIFPMPNPTLPPAPDGLPVPGLVVPAEDGAFWVLVGGSLQKFRLSLLPDKGLVVAPTGPALPIGVPTQPAQLSPRRDAVCFVVRTGTGSGARAVLIRLGDGGPRWQRQLGLVAATAAVPTGGGLLLVGEDGAAAAVPSAGLASLQGVTKAAPEWVAAGPPDGATGRTAVAASADGKTVFAVTPATDAGKPVFTVRRLVDGKPEHTGNAPAPGALAGPPAVVNGKLLLPMSDGFVYRHEPSASRIIADTLTQGPRWRGDRKFPDPVAWVVPTGGDAFVTTDGGRGMARWLWAAGAPYEDGGARWEVRERLAAAPAVLPGADGKPARLLVPDVTGGVWLFAADRAGDALRRWLPGKTTNLPAGRPTGFGVQAAGGKTTAAYVADGRVVGLDPDADAPVWVTAAVDGAPAVVGTPVPAGDGKWLVTDLGGRVRVLDGATGKEAGAKAVGLPGVVPAAAGLPAGDGRVLVPLSDGSAAVVELTAGTPKEKE